jgi:cephalosporin hydroxylase
VDLRQAAVDLQVAAEAHHHTYTWSWLGVPVIRLPEDIVVLPELVWSYRPDVIVETGVARVGSVILSASPQQLVGLPPRVLGIDLQILDHTHEALENRPCRDGITLLESDSTSDDAKQEAATALAGAERAILILDSNHTHDHVPSELRTLAPLVPTGSFVLVADTLIEELPARHFAGRPWGRGNNPLTAFKQLLEEDERFIRDDDWGRRGLLSEFRDGVARRTR